MKIMHRRTISISIICALAPCTGPAWAWGPVTEMTVVTTAVHVLSKDSALPLDKLQRYVGEGASIAAGAEAALFPTFGVDPIGAIETEMYLLQSVRSERVDPYFAFRLGCLGKMVARVTAPLAARDPAYRDAYFADVDKNVSRIEVLPSPRLLVDPQAYFARILRAAREDEETILAEYRAGQGFTGLAKAAMGEDVGRSVNSVADAWFTILSSRAAVANVSGANMQAYALGSMQFYLGQKNVAEIRESYERISGLGLLSTDVRKLVGDMFYDAAMFDRAVEEYRAVLAASPGRRDVMEKLALYFETVGDEAIADKKLEAARDAYASAVESDKLHPTAQSKLMDAESRIVDRDTRLAQARAAIQAAEASQAQAENEALNQNYAGAIALLRDAERDYSKVSAEFPAEATTAGVGLKQMTGLLREWKSRLISSAQSLSGSAASFDAKRLASQTDDVAKPALRDLIDQAFQGEMQALKKNLDDRVTGNQFP